MLTGYFPAALPMAGAPFWPDSAGALWGGAGECWSHEDTEASQEDRLACSLGWWEEHLAASLLQSVECQWQGEAGWPSALLPESLPAPMPEAPAPAAPRQPAAAAPPAALPSPVRLPLGPEPAAPPPMELPPGLPPPPGFTLARAASLPSVEDPEEAAAAGELAPAKVSLGAAAPQLPVQELAPGIHVCPAEVAGGSCTRAEWNVEDLRGKLLASMGRPLVSPPFALQGLGNLRLMVFPDARDAVKSARSRERKGLYSSMIKRGPLHGALKLKADCLEAAVALRFYLTVGDVRRGPFTYDFTECAIHGCEDFGVDWLRQLDAASGSLSVGVEILDAGEDAPAGRATAMGHGEVPAQEEQGAAEMGGVAGGAFIASPACLPGRVRGKRATASQQRVRGC